MITVPLDIDRRPPPEELQKVLPVKEIAQVLGCDARSVRNWIRLYNIPVRDKQRHNVHLFRLSDIYRALEGRNALRATPLTNKIASKRTAASKRVTISVEPGVTLSFDPQVTERADLLSAIESAITFLASSKKEMPLDE